MRGSHCAVILQVVNSKRPSPSRSSQDTIRAKTNRHLDEIKGGTGGPWGYWKSNKWPSPSFISSPCLPRSVRFILRLCLAISLFPTHSPANGYLPCWKGLRFLTGEIDNRTWANAEQPRTNKRERRGEPVREKRTKKKIYIIHVGLPGDTGSPSHSPSQL